jgi:adenine nucleotide transporter 17
MPSGPALAALGHAVSGSGGTAISTAVLYPLDLVTTRLKAQQQLDASERYDGLTDAFRAIITREGGASALYAGLGPDVVKSVTDSFLFFGFYNYLLGRMKAGSKTHVAQDLAIGALAGACSKAVTTPISNVVARMQTSSGSETLREMLVDIKNHSGLVGLWSGYSATLVLTMNPSITFLLNRRLARRIIPALEEEDIPIAWVAFLLAALSKAIATAVTYPFQTGKTRLQMADQPGEGKRPAKDNDRPVEQGGRARLRWLLHVMDTMIFGVIFRIITQEGIKSLYAGLQGELLKSFFSHGLTMLSKGLLHRLVIRLWFTLNKTLRTRRLQAK